MANVSFAYLDQAFTITDTSAIAYSSDENLSATNYSYISTGGFDIDFRGSGITYSGGFPDAGTVTQIEVDPDNDGGINAKEIEITGLNLNITDFQSGTGTAAQQAERFWATALGGSDFLDFTMTDYSVTVYFSGDGSNISDAAVHVGGNDYFTYGAQAMTGSSIITGDYYDISDGTAVGGDDTFTIGAYAILGDFNNISGGASGVGGDDVITPVSLVDTTGGLIYLIGDADVISSGATFAGGDDLIDLRSTDVSALTDTIVAVGDIYGGSGVLAGGDDTIHGSSHGDYINGDVFSSGGVQKGGDDLLYGYDGDDTMGGNASVSVMLRACHC